MVIKRSYDSGLTWTPLEILWTNSTVDYINVIGNAAPVQDRNTGTIWTPLCRNNEEVFMTYSTDDGVTWAEPQYQPHLVLEDWKWVGLGPPGGLQLASGRLLIPGYHTTLWKGGTYMSLLHLSFLMLFLVYLDGCASRGHTILSDDGGETWRIGSSSFGEPFLANECQAVELSNGTVLINARTVSTHRIQVLSHDGGVTFGEPYIVSGLQETIEGCEGSLVRNPSTNMLFFSIPFNNGLIRRNMTILSSADDGINWDVYVSVDVGAVAYSSLQILANGRLALLYERSNTMQLVFDPDEIRFWIAP